jgi:hypothetical protein
MFLISHLVTNVFQTKDTNKVLTHFIMLILVFVCVLFIYKWNLLQYDILLSLVCLFILRPGLTMEPFNSLPQPLEFWNYRHLSPFLDCFNLADFIFKIIFLEEK